MERLIYRYGENNLGYGVGAYSSYLNFSVTLPQK